MSSKDKESKNAREVEEQKLKERQAEEDQRRREREEQQQREIDRSQQNRAQQQAQGGGQQGQGQGIVPGIPLGQQPPGAVTSGPLAEAQNAIAEHKEAEKQAVKEQLEKDPIERQLEREEAERLAALKGPGAGVDAPEVVSRREDGTAVIQAHSPDVDPHAAALVSPPGTTHDGVADQRHAPGTRGVIDRTADASRRIDVAKMGAGKQVDASGSTEPAHPGVRGDIGAAAKSGGGVEILSDEQKRQRHMQPNGPGRPDGDPEKDPNGKGVSGP